jgi:hypothetical protein
MSPEQARLDALGRELAEIQEQQAAMAEILDAIRRSPRDQRRGDEVDRWE